MPVRQPLLAVVAALAVVPGVTACGSDGSSGSDEDALVVYSGRNRDLVGPLLERYEKETGTDARHPLRRLPRPRRHADRGGRRARPADVFFSQDAGALGALSKDDLPDAAAAQRPATRSTRRFRSRDGEWVGTVGARPRHRVRQARAEGVRPAALGPRPHRRGVEGPRRLGADQRVVRVLRHRAAQARGRRRRRARGSRAWSTTTRKVFDEQHRGARRDRQRRDRRRAHQPLLRGRGGRRGGPRLPGRPLLPAGRRPRRAGQRRGRRRPHELRPPGAGAGARALPAVARGAGVLRRQRPRSTRSPPACSPTRRSSRWRTSSSPRASTSPTSTTSQGPWS